MTVDDVLKLLSSQGGIAAILICVLAAGQRGLWYFGRTYDAMTKTLTDELERERRRTEQWQSIALSGTILAERAVERAFEERGKLSKAPP